MRRGLDKLCLDQHAGVTYALDQLRLDDHKGPVERPVPHQHIALSPTARRRRWRLPGPDES
jgi:hypothetical protein